MRTFERLAVDSVLGEVPVSIGAETIAAWDGLFPGSSARADKHLPHGLVIALMMRAYIEVLGERPPGNVHAQQDLIWETSVPKGTDRVIVTLTCQRKELKAGRRWVWFETQLRNPAGVVHLRGTMKLLWAA